MKRLCVIFLTCVCILCSCSSASEKEQETTQHEHVPDGANCQAVQYCADCGEQLAEQGEHDYPDEPDDQVDRYLFYACRICGQVKIINQDGLPVVPVE